MERQIFNLLLVGVGLSGVLSSVIPFSPTDNNELEPFQGEYKTIIRKLHASSSHQQEQLQSHDLMIDNIITELDRYKKKVDTQEVLLKDVMDTVETQSIKIGVLEERLLAVEDNDEMGNTDAAHLMEFGQELFNVEGEEEEEDEDDDWNDELPEEPEEDEENEEEEEEEEEQEEEEEPGINEEQEEERKEERNAKGEDSDFFEYY